MNNPLISRAVQARAKLDRRCVETPKSDRWTIAELFIIAVLLTLYFIIRFPALGAVIAQYNQF